MRMRILVVSCLSTMLMVSLSGCGNTMSGFKTDIIQKRQVVSDFINPSIDSDESVEETKTVD